MSNKVKAKLLLRDRVILSERAFGHQDLASPLVGARECARPDVFACLVVDRTCVLRYDNEAGKGDHRHAVEGREEPCRFAGVETLIEDFWKEVDAWMTKWSS